MNRCPASPAAARGFSLVELAVGLVAMGLIGIVVWATIARTGQLAMGEASGPRVVIAEQALVGFLVANHRLPCPDVTGNGVEDCSSASASGELPWRTLALGPDVRLRYGVHRAPGSSTDLTATSDRHVPLLPVDGAVTGLNGLDFCVALVRAQASAVPGAGLAGGVPVAFVLADPGAEDRNGDGDLFDPPGGGGFHLPGRPTDDSDDITAAVGFGELSTRLGCGRRLSEVAGAVRGAWAADDLVAYTAAYVQYRELVVVVRDALEKDAIAQVTMASVSIVLTTAGELASIQLTLQTGGVSAFTKVLTAAKVVLAVKKVVYAAVKLALAQTEATTAADLVGPAITLHARNFAQRDALRERARALTEAGLTP
jgi:hypothetical protein